METKTARFCDSTASSSFWELVGADDLVASEIRESPLEFDDAYPFERLGTDAEIDYVYGRKRFPIGTLDSSVTAPIFRAYLRIIMPEMASVHALFEQLWIDWKICGIHENLGEAFELLSHTTKGMLDGSVTFEGLYSGFMTPENRAAINAVHESNKRLTDKEIVEIVLEGQSLVLSSGVL